jgi:CHASE3 domain sensor protein
VAHTFEVRAALATLQRGLTDAETNQRGYLLVGAEELLGPYARARDLVRAELADVRQLTRDNPRQQARLDTLERVAGARVAFLDTTVTLFRAGRRDDAVRLVATGRGRRLMDEARRVGAAMDAEEGRLLDARLAAADRARWTLYASLCLGTALAVGVAVLANLRLLNAALREARSRAALHARSDALERAELRLRHALVAGRTETWDWDAVRRQVVWSGARVASPAALGDGRPEPAAEFLGRVHPDDRPRLRAALRRARASRDESVHEFRLLGGGAPRWMLGRGRFFYDADGRAVRAAGTLTDVTDRHAADDERARLEASLRLSETMSAIGTVAAGVAHEVRNPLFGMSSVLDALDASFPARVELRPFLDKLRQQVARVNDLMADLLEYGRPAADTRAPVPLGDVLDAALRNCRPLADTRQVALRPAFDREALPPAPWTGSGWCGCSRTS